jgi:hypothetical protein
MQNWCLGEPVMKLLLLLLGASGFLPAQSNGVSTEWDVRTMLDGLALQTQHLKSVIGQVNTDGMTASGAPQTYISQWNTAQAELKYLLGSIDALAKQPERLPLALEAYFRMQAMESTLGSVFEGIRKYQNPALADLLQGIVNENSVNRDHLRQYIQDLAVQKEQEFEVADKEAQRCRGSIARQPGASTKEKKQ